MISAKGFLKVDKLFNNQDNSTAVFGELTQHASTFARDYKTFTKPNSEMSFCLFSCKDGINKASLAPQYAETTIAVGEWLYTTSTAVNSTITKSEYGIILQDAFGNSIRNVVCGDITTNGLNILPKWVSFEIVTSTSSILVKVWLDSLDFQSSYDETEILIVPQVDYIDELFMPYVDLLQLLNKNNIAIIHDRVNEVRNKFPESILRTEIIEVIDRTNTRNRSNVAFTALIYGPNGDNTDAIKEAIKNFITNNSSNNENDWRLLLPDLFNITCFYVLPRWDRFAIASRLSMPGVHSPVVSYSENFDYVKGKVNSFINQDHLNDNLQSITNRYKSICLNVVGGVDNRLNLYKFTDYFGDYIAESTLSEDFNRQSRATKDITILLTSMLLKIDTLENNPNLPANLRVIEKHNKRWLVAKQENIEYYVLMKDSHQ